MSRKPPGIPVHEDTSADQGARGRNRGRAGNRKISAAMALGFAQRRTSSVSLEDTVSSLFSSAAEGSRTVTRFQRSGPRMCSSGRTIPAALSSGNPCWCLTCKRSCSGNSRHSLRRGPTFPWWKKNSSPGTKRPFKDISPPVPLPRDWRHGVHKD